MSAESAVPQAAGRHRRLFVRERRREMVPLCRLAKVNSARVRLAEPLQQPARREAAGPGRARHRRARRSRSSRRSPKNLPPDFSYDWGGASYQEKRPRHVGPRARHGRDHGVPDPRGAVRALVAAAVGAAGHAVRHLRRAGRGLAARHDQRRLLPDRSGHAARPGREERHPDRRVRAAEVPGRPVGLRRGTRGGAPAPPPDPHDLAGVHPRRAAAGALDGRGAGARVRWARA
jgi:hypothetical protein